MLLTVCGLSVKDLRQIAGQRNNLAHGHFDQNAYDGTYDVVTKSTRSQYSVEKINALTEVATKAWDQLRSAEADYMFIDVVVAPRPPPRAVNGQWSRKPVF